MEPCCSLKFLLMSQLHLIHKRNYLFLLYNPKFSNFLCCSWNVFINFYNKIVTVQDTFYQITFIVTIFSALFQQIKSRQGDCKFCAFFLWWIYIASWTLVDLVMRQFNAGSAQGAAEVYDPDGYFMPNGHSPVKGRAGIEQYFKQDMADGVTSAQVGNWGIFLKICLGIYFRQLFLFGCFGWILQNKKKSLDFFVFTEIR